MEEEYSPVQSNEFLTSLNFETNLDAIFDRIKAALPDELKRDLYFLQSDQ